MIEYHLATSDEEYAAAKALFTEYAQAIGINLDFQHFDEELDGLKNMYATPVGGIILAKDKGQFVGCVAIRKINKLEGELKRMFIQPGYRNLGMGKILLEKALALAEDCGYKSVKLDTLNYMLPAIHLYRKAGFYEIDAYYYNPIETAVYFEKKL